MTCFELAQRIESMQGDLSPIDVARLCLLILNQDPDAALLMDDESLEKLRKQTVFRMESAADQHAAITRELEAFAESDPVTFDPEQLWMLLRAVKIQGQVLELYLNEPARL